MIFLYSYAFKSVKNFSEKCAFYFHNLGSVNLKDVWFDSYFRSRQKYNNMVAMDAETSSSHAV